MHTAIFKLESHFEFTPTLRLTRDFFCEFHLQSSDVMNYGR